MSRARAAVGAVLILTLVVAPPSALAQAAPTPSPAAVDPDVTLGIRQVDEGDYDAGTPDPIVFMTMVG